MHSINRLFLISFVALLAACGASTDADVTELTVFAGSSLTDAFHELSSAFVDTHPNVRIVYNFAGSQTLRAQLEQGARADIFASANERQMQLAQDADLLDDASIQAFVHNRLTVIVPKENPANIQSLQDLAQPGLKLVFATEEVPVGSYTVEAIERMSHDPSFGTAFAQSVQSNVASLEANVRLIVAKVQLGEADAGIVYTSDITPGVANEITSINIPNAFNIVADYPIAILRESDHSQLATQFIEFILSSSGQTILTHWGFIAARP